MKIRVKSNASKKFTPDRMTIKIKIQAESKDKKEAISIVNKNIEKIKSLFKALDKDYDFRSIKYNIYNDDNIYVVVNEIANEYILDNSILMELSKQFCDNQYIKFNINYSINNILEAMNMVRNTAIENANKTVKSLLRNSQLEYGDISIVEINYAYDQSNDESFRVNGVVDDILNLYEYSDDGANETIDYTMTLILPEDIEVVETVEVVYETNNLKLR